MKSEISWLHSYFELIDVAERDVLAENLHGLRNAYSVFEIDEVVLQWWFMGSSLLHLLF